jgi:hypothetical protein
MHYFIFGPIWFRKIIPTHVSRLTHPLSGSKEWVEYDGTSIVNKVWNGRASLFELDVSGPAGHIEGVGLRLYNPETNQWSLNWANSSDGVIWASMIGVTRRARRMTGCSYSLSPRYEQPFPYNFRW